MARTPRRLLLALGLAALILPSASRAQDDGIISIGWTAWDDAEVVSKLAAVIIGQGMREPVELTLADIDQQYRNVANGSLDLMLMSWQPRTHESYLDRYGDDLVDLGPLYDGTTIGWAVPAYVPEDIATPRDLTVQAQRFGSRIIGIDPGAGLMRRSRELIEVAGLRGWQLTEGTGPLMAQTVIEAASNQEWFVATLWNPHWLFAEVEMRYLEDSEGVFGPPEAVHALARDGFEQDYPAVAGFVRRFRLDIPTLEALMAAARRDGTRTAIDDFIAANTDTVRYWMTGQQ